MVNNNPIARKIVRVSWKILERNDSLSDPRVLDHFDITAPSSPTLSSTTVAKVSF